MRPDFFDAGVSGQEGDAVMVAGAPDVRCIVPAGVRPGGKMPEPVYIMPQAMGMMIFTATARLFWADARLRLSARACPVVRKPLRR